MNENENLSNKKKTTKEKQKERIKEKFNAKREKKSHY